MTHFKYNVILYQDEVKLFLEQEMEKIEWFRGLSLTTKSEILYGMKRTGHQSGALLQRRNQNTDTLFLLQSGSLLVYSHFGYEEIKFNIERLDRGAIINTRSFLINDVSQVNYKCIGHVSVFTLTLAHFKDIMSRRSDLLKVYKTQENALLNMQQELGLDYIYENNAKASEYEKRLKTNALRIRLKNAMVQTWTQVKAGKRPLGL